MKYTVGFFLPKNSDQQQVMPPSLGEGAPFELETYYYEKDNGRLLVRNHSNEKVCKEELERCLVAGISFHEDFSIEKFNFATLAGMGGALGKKNLFRCGYYWKTLAHVMSYLIETDRNKGSRVLYLNSQEILGEKFCAALNLQGVDSPRELSEVSVGDYQYIIVYGYGEKYINQFVFLIRNKGQLNRSVQIYADPNYYFVYNKIEEISDEDKEWLRDHVTVISGLRSIDGRQNDFQRFVNTSADILSTALLSMNDRMRNDERKETISGVQDYIKTWLKKCHFYESEEFGSLFFREDGEVFFPLFRYNGLFEQKESAQIKEYVSSEFEISKEYAAEQIGSMADVCKVFSKDNDVVSVPKDLRIEAGTVVADVLNQCGEVLRNVARGSTRIDFFMNYHEIEYPFFSYLGKQDESFVWIPEIVKSLFSVAGNESLQLNFVVNDLEDNNTLRLYFRDDKSGLVRNLSVAERVHKFAVAKSEESVSLDSQKWAKSFIDETYKRKILEYGRDNKFLYVIPAGQSCQGMGTGVIVWTPNKLSLFDIQIINTLVSIPFAALWNQLMRQDCMTAQVSSAIGSIMSRNGSHNIGSHVLAALSHNVGTMPDDRVLYQYIQHRMDYIATATTEMPTWTSVAKLATSAIKNFLSQRHLLDHIAGSEGLHGYKFQDPNLQGEAILKQKNVIRIHLTHELSDGTRIDMIPYGSTTDDAVRKNCQKYDVDVAFPGGLVGQQAFFNIIENVIRNAAKHGWAVQDAKTRGDALDVYINVKGSNLPNVLNVTVYDGLSNVEKISEVNGENLIKCLNQKLVQPFFTDSGTLRRENWGLAEMRISAGYLQRRTIAEIGGIPDARPRKGGLSGPIIKAVEVDKHVGYEFTMLKPKDVLLVVRSGRLSLDEAVISDLERIGVFLRVCDNQAMATDDEQDYNFRYVVIPEYLEGQKNPFLPFRVFAKQCVKKDGTQATGPEVIVWIGAIYDRLVEIVESSNIAAEDKARQIKQRLYTAWIRYWAFKRRQLDYVPDLIIQTESSGVSSDDTGKAEQCLLKDDDGWSVVFGDVFHSFAGEGESVRAESSYEDCNEASQAFFEFLLFVASLPERRIAEIPAGIKSKECVIARQLLSWYDSYADQLKIEKFQHDIQGRAQSFVDRYKCFRPCVGLVDGQRTLLTRFDDQNVRERIGRFVEALRKWVGNDCSEASWPQCDDCEYDGLRLFVDELKVSFLQTHVMVRKYEERIVTLPKSFSAKSVTVDKQNANSTSGVPYDQVGVSVHLLPKGALNEKHSTQKSVNYLRHYDASDFAANFAHMMYAEPLSGTQGYLNMIVGLKALPDAGGFVANLMESALARILIVDERVADFLRAHPAQMKVFSMMGIWSVDDKAYGDENRSCNETTIDERLPLLNGHILLNLYMLAGIRRAMIKNDSNDSKSLERWKTRIRTRLSRHFDILIIHQGLIDKWLQGASSNRNVVSMLIEYLKQIVPYVIITTGRGTPANIPATARILPFSVVESTLFRNNPEKMVLIDTIMSILPTGERK